MSNNAALPSYAQSADRILRLPEVSSISGLSRSRIYALMAEGLFPKQLKIGRSSGWLQSEVIGWLHARIEDRDSGLSKILGVADDN